MSQPLDSPIEHVEQALTTARRTIRYTRKTKKVLDSIRGLHVEPSNIDQFSQVREALRELVGKSGCTDLDAAIEAWDQSSADLIEETARIRRHELVEALREGANERDIDAQLLAQNPPTLSLGLFRIEVHASSHVSIKVGLEPIVDVEPRADTVFQTCDDIVASWQERTPEAPQLFERLRRAYHMTCSMDEKSPGERVDIVDMLAPLALLESGTTPLRRHGLDSVRCYPRHLLARQLAMLNREEMLEHRGYRLELGAATGGSTNEKRDVMYVQTAPRRGQYFLSIRFARI